MNFHDELAREVLRKEFLEVINTLRLQREAVRGKTLFDQGSILGSGWASLLDNHLCQRFQKIAPDSFRISRQKC